ncbi:hypothetical protein FSC37_03740 [Piscinibacter aquaticus]|uniref:DUF1579 domain-containing protein n=1 Tax=Piscinibacter aquaticus TaxID=392597 RepID=A0A5C6TY48_9BURK|nr:hypothetical protein FSC37_03740 [Piscinibacter aquaticus]
MGCGRAAACCRPSPAAALAPMVAQAPAATSRDEALPIPGPAPGHAGEFDFLTGEWRIRHRRLKDSARDEWDHFDGEATCWSILGGVASIEELRIPSRQFSGMGLRLFDGSKGHWFELWTNAKGPRSPGPACRGFSRRRRGVRGRRRRRRPAHPRAQHLGPHHAA